MMDLLTHLLHTHYDPLWLFMNEDNESLQKRLAKSKETEKQNISLSTGIITVTYRVYVFCDACA